MLMLSDGSVSVGQNKWELGLCSNKLCRLDFEMDRLLEVTGLNFVGSLWFLLL